MSDSDPSEPTKLFISHASEDKDEFVRPLVAELENAGFAVWFDEYELTMGDSLFSKISDGLNRCDFGVVVLSPSFFEKKWTRAELGGLFALETAEKKVILPIWKDVSEEDVKGFSPMLADRLGVPSTKSLETIVEDVQRAVQVAERTAEFSSVENEIARFVALDKRVAGAREAEKLANSSEGVTLVRQNAQALFADFSTKVNDMAESAETLRIVVEPKGPNDLIMKGPFNLDVIMQFQNSVQNTISRAELSFRVYQRYLDAEDLREKSRLVMRREFKPVIHHTGILIWKDKREEKQYSIERLSIQLLADIVNVFSEIHEKETNRNAN